MWFYWEFKDLMENELTFGFLQAIDRTDAFYKAIELRPNRYCVMHALDCVLDFAQL
jgi:hypothetical protein